MIFDENFIEFINLLESKKSKFVLVGGMAVIVHGVNRTTKDIDIFYEPTSENCKKILAAINDFGFKYLRLSVSDLMDKSGYIQLGNEPIRIDLFCDLPGVDFETVFKESKEYEEEDFKIKVIHINHLIQNKMVVGRHQDLWDVERLQKILKKRNSK